MQETRLRRVPFQKTGELPTVPTEHTADQRYSMTHTRRKSLPMLSSGPTGRQEPLQMEGSSVEQGAEVVEPGTPESPGHLTGRRKNYPLRKRPLVPEKPKACKVLLTRLENVAGPRSADEADELPPDLPKPPSPAPSSEDTGLPQPRKRRLASLNAEALNNLLLEREDTSSLVGTRRSRGGDSHRSRDRDRATGGWASSKKRPRLGDLGGGSRDLSPESAPDEEADGHSTEPPAPKAARPKWAKVNGKNYPRARQGAGSGDAAGPAGWQGHPEEPWPPATPREESPAPKQELHQPSFPAPQLSPLPMPGNPADYSGLCGRPELTALGNFYLYCSQDGLQLPVGTPFQHPPWGSRYCSNEDSGVNGYSICEMLPPSLTHIGTTCGGCPYKMPFAAGKQRKDVTPPRSECSRTSLVYHWFVAQDEPEPAIRKSYQAVERHGETIRVRDTVLLKSGPRKTSTPYVAKISALWENPESGELMMSLLWYYRPEHLQGGRSPSMHENEVFASRHQDQNSVACIEEKCYVLTFAEYCRFCAMAKRRGEGLPSRKTALVPPSVDYSTPPHRTVPEDTDPELVFLCRHVYDFRHGRILKNPQ
ncbi:bromo adjacenty domain containing 1-like protein [Camelus ferus]|nr:bromo adjacenty domain containing 1-like protein [Camelus ferus]